MLEWIVNTMDALGYLGILLLMFLENVFFPLPSEIIMPLAGFMVSQGKLSFVVCRCSCNRYNWVCYGHATTLLLG